nr:hypothetical protein [Streptomyces flaveolus]
MPSKAALTSDRTDAQLLRIARDGDVAAVGALSNDTGPVCTPWR